MILIDTSIWIAYFRTGPRPVWHEFLSERLLGGSAAIVPPVATELLIGARSDRERSVIHDLTHSVQILGTGMEDWIAAGELGREWRQRGRTLSIVDCLLAAVAHQHRVALWSLDNDFDPLFASGYIEPVRLL